MQKCSPKNARGTTASTNEKTRQALATVLKCAQCGRIFTNAPFRCTSGGCTTLPAESANWLRISSARDFRERSPLVKHLHAKWQTTSSSVPCLGAILVPSSRKKIGRVIAKQKQGANQGGPKARVHLCATSTTSG